MLRVRSNCFRRYFFFYNVYVFLSAKITHALKPTDARGCSVVSGERWRRNRHDIVAALASNSVTTSADVCSEILYTMRLSVIVLHDGYALCSGGTW